MAKAYDVIIKGTGMGVGEKTLTDNLMNGFIYTLTQKEKLPKNIVLYGEGVKLSCKGSACLADLKALADKGVEVLSCGICLDYYDMADNLEVGRVTTMGEVVDIFANSDLIVEP